MLSATVDRNQIALNETLTLTISKDGSSSISSSDLQPLEKDFWIVGQSKSSNTQFKNGSITSSFILNLVLSPKRAGNLQIPTLSIGKEKTSILKVKVVTQAQPKTRTDIAPLYIETDVSARTVLVQSQLIFTLRIFWAVEASIVEPADPRLKDVLMERLQDTTFNKIVDGQSYKVFERKYAIFPQKSGMLEIPQIVVQATIPNRQRRHGNIYDLFGASGKKIQLRSESEIITVEQRPAEYPLGVEWLPTDKLSVVDEWSQESKELLVGESVTITIAMTAQGLLGAQLPQIELPATEGVKLYQSKAEVQNRLNSAGITGIRKESIALIPIRAGKVELPEIRIPWWNRKQQKVEYATIPARQLIIKASTAKTGQAITATSPLSNSGEDPIPPAALTSSPQISLLNKPLLALCAVLVLAWLMTIIMLLKSRRQVRVLLGDGRLELAATNDVNESAAYRKFVHACRNNDPVRGRKTVIDWARAFFPEKQVRTTADLGRVLPDSNLPALLDEIDDILYSHGGKAADWCGKSLLETVGKIRKTDRKKRSNKSALAELYK
jgi:hypothetical protein